MQASDDEEQAGDVVDSYTEKVHELTAAGQQSTQAAWDALVSDSEERSEYDDTQTYDTMHITDDTHSTADSTNVKQKLDHVDDDGHAGASTFRSDVVEYDPATQCRVRFARYRGLKSFSGSAWHAMESLPIEYSQIYRFANFAQTQKRILSTNIHSADVSDDNSVQSNGVQPQRYMPITVHISNVSSETARAYIQHQQPCVLFGLHEHEHKISVCHYVVQRNSQYTAPVKAKQLCEFQVAFRRFYAQPIYSHHDTSTSTNNKHLTQRYLPHNTFTVVSVYARITYQPATVLMFETNDATDCKSTVQPAPALIGAGSLHSIDPNRLLIKRIILTGHCVDTHKRSAVVRHMFFNADDIAWFKPIELWTKHGHVGHIKESRM